MEDNTIDTTDRISELPVGIAHHIMSFMDSPVELVRISVLSKKWFAITASFPILDFDIYKMREILYPHPSRLYTREEFMHVKNEFYNYVGYTLSRFREQNVTAHTFKLIVATMESADLVIVKNWVDSIVEENEVKVLWLDLGSWSGPCYEKPKPMLYLHKTLVSATCLTSLTLCGCGLSSLLIADGVKFKWLKSLSLDTIPLNKKMIRYLTTHCPLLEEFNVKCCFGFKTFCIDGVQNLKRVDICYMDELERIDIEAPNLYELSLKDWDSKGLPCFNLSSCEKLTTVYFQGDLYPTSDGFISNFPFVETLFMNIYDQCSNLKFSSRSLRRLELHAQCDLEGIEMDTPNLILFKYSDQSRSMYFYLPTNSAHSKRCMEYYTDNVVDALWFQKLRRFLDKNNGFNVLKLHIKDCCMDVEELKAVQSPPFELEHVKLKLEPTTTLSSHVAAVNGVLWCFCPRSITLVSNFPSIDSEEWNNVVKLTYEMLLQQEDEGQSNIQMVMSSKSKAKKHLSNLHSLLTTLPRDELVEITFTKEQGIMLFKTDSCSISREMCDLKL